MFSVLFDTHVFSEDVPHVLFPGLLAGVHEGCCTLADSVHGGYGPGRIGYSSGVGAVVAGRTLSHC